MGKQIKEAVKAEVREQAKIASRLPDKEVLNYSATKDNIIVEVFWKPEEEGALDYVPTHLRGENGVIVISCGNMVKDVKVGDRVITSVGGKLLANDEKSGVFAVKEHEILAVVK